MSTLGNVCSEFCNRIMLNLYNISIIDPFWENRKSEVYLLFREGEEEKFKDKLKGILLRLISILIALQTFFAVSS